MIRRTRAVNRAPAVSSNGRSLYLSHRLCINYLQKPLGAKPCITSKAFWERSEPTFGLTILFISYSLSLFRISNLFQVAWAAVSSIWNWTNCLAGIILQFFVDTLFFSDILFFSLAVAFLFLLSFLGHSPPRGLIPPFASLNISSILISTFLYRQTLASVFCIGSQ